MKHVIIGAGAAGITAAKTIRERHINDEIVIISTDEAVYSRCMLHHYISGQRSLQALSFVTDDFFKDNNIKWLSNVTVAHIDTKGRQVVLECGGYESYDRLLIATGAQSAFPDIKGLSGTLGVFGLRDLPDARAIAEKAVKAEHVVILGAGLVGMDAAYGLLALGKKPVVVEMAKNILSVNLDSMAAAAYQEQFEQAGASFKLEAKICEVLSDARGAISSVELSDGEQLPCDLLIIATSIRPNVKWLESSGISLERGVVVDKYLTTSAEGVYAAGDVTGISGTWPDAMSQGETAAMNMCGCAVAYSDFIPPMKCTMSFFGIPTLSVGRFIASDGDEVTLRMSKDRYEKVVMRDDIPVGVILQGDISRSGYWQYLIKNQVSTAGIQKPIWKVSFADAYSIESNGEYKWVL
ncbi:MAG: FAD-dependent oxidoreductase [Oscillospiraceae bacterium]|nr:FAD-dependent oxidoreductase [Oscillospiraceae bacterium]